MIKRSWVQIPSGFSLIFLFYSPSFSGVSVPHPNSIKVQLITKITSVFRARLVLGHDLIRSFAKWPSAEANGSHLTFFESHRPLKTFDVDLDPFETTFSNFGATQTKTQRPHFNLLCFMVCRVAQMLVVPTLHFCSSSHRSSECWIGSSWLIDQ